MISVEPEHGGCKLAEAHEASPNLAAVEQRDEWCFQFVKWLAWIVYPSREHHVQKLQLGSGWIPVLCESLLNPSHSGANWAWEKPDQFYLVQVSKVVFQGGSFCPFWTADPKSSAKFSNSLLLTRTFTVFLPNIWGRQYYQKSFSSSFTFINNFFLSAREVTDPFLRLPTPILTSFFLWVFLWRVLWAWRVCFSFVFLQVGLLACGLHGLFCQSHFLFELNSLLLIFLPNFYSAEFQPPEGPMPTNHCPQVCPSFRVIQGGLHRTHVAKPLLSIPLSSVPSQWNRKDCYYWIQEIATQNGVPNASGHV